MPLAVTSHMNEAGVIVADKIEQDSIAFDWGQRVRLGPAAQTLNLVVG